MPLQATMLWFRSARYVRRHPAGYRRPDRLSWWSALPIIMATSLLLWAAIGALCFWLY